MSDPLDLGSSASAPTPAATPVARSVAGPVRHDLQLPGTREGEVRLLSDTAPVVALTEAQSATGGFVVSAAISQPNDLILVAAYELADGREGVVVPSLHPVAPDTTTPVLRAAAAITLDLSRLALLRRMFVVGVPRRSDLRLPGGALTAATSAGARVDLPIGAEVTLGAKALLTAYVVEDALVLRAEQDPFSGTLQQVCGAYGYDGLSWRDPFTPL